MRILVFSQAAWNTANSFGNTVTNWFEGWDDTHFFHFYARQQKPNTDIVEKYYNVSAIEILKKSLRGQQAGRIFVASEVVEERSIASEKHEQKQITKLHKNKNEILYWGIEQVWRSEKWINKFFDEFVNEANPDIIFAFATNPYILKPAIEHIKKINPSVKVVLWIADDILAGYEQNAWYRRGYLRKGIDYCINNADILYGASVEMCEKYSAIYGKKVTPLYKGCTFNEPSKEKNNFPLRLVYAGNLLYGRLDTLEEIIKALRAINEDGCKAVLEVYSNTPIAGKVKNEWFDDINASYMGTRTYLEIKTIMNEADIVLQVESFERKQMETVQNSFSTKIIDCLQSGSQVLGIGPGEIASIRYLKNVDGAIVIDSQEQINNVISGLVRERETIIMNAQKTRNYAMKNHDKNHVRQELRKDFENLLDRSDDV